MIEFQRVSKMYGNGYTALSNVSILIEKGEFVFLTGMSGAGKTTFLKHIYLEEKPTHGRVTISGLTSKFNSKLKLSKIQKLRRDMGILFQDIRLLNDRTVFENIIFVSRLLGGSEKAINKRAFEALSNVRLSHKFSEYPQQLSGGEQQRVALARAIVNEPNILIVDEPTGNLDRKISDEIFKLIQRINARGVTVIMATHDRNFIDKTHYREIILDNGEVVKGANILSKLKL